MAPCVTGSFAISAFNILTPQHSLLLHANADRPVKLHCWAREMESCIISLLHALSVPSQTRRPAAYGGLAAATSVLGLIDEVALIGSSIRSFKEERRGIDSCWGVFAHPLTTYQGPESRVNTEGARTQLKLQTEVQTTLQLQKTQSSQANTSTPTYPTSPQAGEEQASKQISW